MSRATEREWVVQFPETLELITSHLIATGRWPDPVALERAQREIGSSVPVLEAVGRMPSQVGGRSYSPSEVRLSLAALGSSQAGRPLVEAVYLLLEFARRRFADPLVPARISVRELAETEVDPSQWAALSRLIADGSIIFLGGGSAGVESWDLEISERLVVLDGCTDADSLIALLKVWYWQPPKPPVAPERLESHDVLQNPTALISYAQSSTPWQGKVLEFTTALRAFGIDAEMDIFHATEHEEWATFGSRLVQSSDFTLIPVDAAYRRRWEGTEADGIGAGAIREAAALKSILERDRREFVRRVKVVLLPGALIEDVPAELLGMVERFQVPSIDAAGLDALLRALTGQPPHPRPPLGDLPVLPPKAIADLISSAQTSEAADHVDPLDDNAPALISRRDRGPVAAESEAPDGQTSEPSEPPGGERLATESELRQRNVVEARALIEEAVLAAPLFIQAQAGLRSVHSTRYDDQNAVSEAMAAYSAVRERMIAFDTRLILRLDFSHPVRQALAKLIQVTDAAGQDVIGLITFDEPPPADRMERSAKERLEMYSARERLLVAAAAWMRGA